MYDPRIPRPGRVDEQWSRPHTPHDEWHPDFRFEGMVHYARAALEIGRRRAHEPSMLDELIERNPRR